MSFTNDRWHKKVDGKKVRTSIHGKPGKRWQACWVDALGKQHAKGCDTRTEAEDFLGELERQRRTGTYTDPKAGRVTVGALAPKWIDARSDLKPTTESRYRGIIAKHIVPTWGAAKVSEIQPSDVQGWVAQLGKGGDDALTPASVRKVFRVLSQIMDVAVMDGRIARNPCEKVKLPRLVQARRQYLTHAQVHQLARLASQPDNPSKHRRADERGECETQRLVILTLAYTGLRYSELAALKVGSLDTLRRRINVTESVTEPNGRLTWGVPKDYECRSVPVSPSLNAQLAAHADGRDRGELLFTGVRGGGVLRNRNFRNGGFDRAAEAMGLSDLVPHELRHTAASLAVSAGANVKAVQRMLGHANASMTLDVYADLFEDDLDAVGDALDAGFTEALSGARAESSLNQGRVVSLDDARPTAVGL